MTPVAYTLTIDISQAKLGDVQSILNYLGAYGSATQSGTIITLTVQVGKGPPVGTPGPVPAAVDLWDLRGLASTIQAGIAQWVPGAVITRPVAA